MKKLSLPSWARDRLQQRLEQGGAATALRGRGYTWTEIADALGLGDDREARRTAMNYLLYSSARPIESAQDASEGAPLPDDHPPDGP